MLVDVDIRDDEHCRQLVQQTVDELGGLDSLVDNTAYQMAQPSLQDISNEQLERTFRTNIFSMFYLCRAAEKHLKPGSTVVNTTSINAYKPGPTLLDSAATKAAIQNFTANLGQVWAEKGIRVNCVTPGPIRTPLIPSTMDPEKVKHFGHDGPLGRAGQPAERAAAYVLRAANDSSYMTGSTIQVTGGTPSIQHDYQRMRPRPIPDI